MALVVLGQQWQAPPAVVELQKLLFRRNIVAALVRGSRLGDPSRVWPPLDDEAIHAAEEAARAAASIREATNRSCPYEQALIDTVKAGHAALHGFDGFGVYLGSLRHTLDKKRLVDRQVSSILTIIGPHDVPSAKAAVAAALPGVEHHCWECQDVEEDRHAILNSWPAIVKQIALCQEEGKRVAVHCHAGVSRSASCVLAWLVTPGRQGGPGLCLAEAARVLQRGRPLAMPNEGFLAALVVYSRALRLGEEPPLYVNDEDAQVEAEAILATLSGERATAEAEVAADDCDEALAEARTSGAADTSDSERVPAPSSAAATAAATDCG